MKDVAAANRINPEFLKPHLSTKLYRSTFNYLKTYYSDKLFEEICRELGIPVSYLISDDNWVSVDFGRRFAELVRQKTNDPYVYRKIGTFFFDPKNINPVEHSFLRTLSPFGLFKSLPRMYKRTNLACALDVRAEAWGHYRIEITALYGTVYSDLVINTLGVLEGLEEFYGLQKVRIDLDREVRPGEEVPKFALTIQFSAARYVLERVVKVLIFAGLGLGLGYLIHILEQVAGLSVLPFMSAAFAILLAFFYSTIKSLAVIKKNIESYYEKGREKNLHLYQKSELLERRYREADLLRALSAELITVSNPRNVLVACLDWLKSNFKFNKTAVFLVAKKRKKLFLAESRGLEELHSKIGEVEFDFPNPNAKEGFFASILERGEKVLIMDVEGYKNTLQPRNQRLVELIGATSMIVCPIQTRDQKYGLLITFREAGQLPLTEQDLSLLEKISNFLALYFDKAANFDRETNLRKIFQQFVPPVVLEQYVKDGIEDVHALEPQRCEVISIFADLRRFTTISEKMAPERVVQVISLYADFIAGIFAPFGAVIDNIVGDEVVMFFRCSSEDAGKEIRSVFAALEQMDQRWPDLMRSVKSLGLSELDIGVGVHMGSALVGTVGGEIKRNYTALGDVINVASRLQSLSKNHQAGLAEGHLSALVSADVFARAGVGGLDFHSERLRGRDDESKYAIVDQTVIAKILNHGSKEGAAA